LSPLDREERQGELGREAGIDAPRPSRREKSMRKKKKNQGDLFDPRAGKPEGSATAYALYAGTPPHRGVETSIEAAVSMMPAISKLQERVLDFIRGKGPDGATDDEIATGLGMFLYTAAPRRRELVLLELVAYSGRHRPTSRGNPARVWVAAEPTEGSDREREG